MVKWWRQVETNEQNTLVNANTCTVLITFTNNLWPIWVSEMLEIHLEWKVLNASSVLFDSYVDNIIEGFFSYTIFDKLSNSCHLVPQIWNMSNMPPSAPWV